MTDELLIKYLLEETSTEEHNLVKKWLKEDKKNQEQFDQMRFLWKKSTDLLKDETLPDEAKAWAQFKNKRDRLANKNEKSWNIFQMMAAASVVLITGIALWLFLTRDFSHNNIISKNEVISDILSDGSSITVNKNSQLSVNVSTSARLVKLKKGEVFFKVAPDKTRPFMIELGNSARITVLGTSFNVKYREETAEIIVETGLVKVSNNNADVILHPGEKAAFNHKDSTLLAVKNNDALYKYFRNNEFVIDNVPLHRVVKVLSEAYSTKIILADKDLANLKLNVKFKDEPLDKILEVISATFGLKLIKEKDHYILQKNK